MARALETIRAAGFQVAISDDLQLYVAPVNRITDALREFVRKNRGEIVASLQAERAAMPTQPPKLPKMAPLTRAEWETLASAYQAHHAACPVCIAAGKGYGLRCGTGAALWTEYDRADQPPRTRAKK